jgi:hypothetical protein
MAGIFLDGRTHSAVFYGADAIKEIYVEARVVAKSPATCFFVRAEWSANG